ncbi:Cysteine-rich transmembrane CYSTM domain-containing protein [Dioscorea alata]|uniref:Cysteine-rich transmembrane CYSTM domain-containing protein n=1 Tax=Dioscorea alata TaxID=55571 RepID=A0ACB7V1G4_DIOAL|nr:Cysteine-rich transmembrane CYSTM domain-containing protein [Dioscorea alata]
MDRMETTRARSRKDSPPTPPPGYPTIRKQSEKACLPKTSKKGERGFIEGCLAALCCCWICETCCP